MKRELKIVIEYEAEGIDCDYTTPLCATRTFVYHDGVHVGAIQKIAFVASANEFTPELEITFPDTSKWSTLGADVVKKIDANVRIFEKIPGVKISRS